MFFIENTNCTEINANNARIKTNEIHFSREISTWFMLVLIALRNFDWYP